MAAPEHCVCDVLVRVEALQEAGKAGLTCWLNVSSTVSPRRRRIERLPSARSAAELEAQGYSPPTPTVQWQRQRGGRGGREPQSRSMHGPAG